MTTPANKDRAPAKRHGRTAFHPNPLDVQCPWCFERPENHCRAENGGLLDPYRFHSIRIAAARQVKDPANG